MLLFLCFWSNITNSRRAKCSLNLRLLRSEMSLKESCKIPIKGNLISEKASADRGKRGKLCAKAHQAKNAWIF